MTEEEWSAGLELGSPEFLSSWNQPSSLLYAILHLQRQGVTPGRVRIIPTIAHFASPEIVSAGDNTSIQVSIRSDNRLYWLYPLIHVGLPDLPGPGASGDPDSGLRELATRLALKLADAQYKPYLKVNKQEIDCLATYQWLIECNPEWIERLGFVPMADGAILPGYSTPVQWLARLWRTLYPQLTPVEPHAATAEFRLRLVEDRLVQERNPGGTQNVRDDLLADRQRDAATLLAERFFTILFHHLASIEMLEGAAYPLDWRIERWDKLDIESRFTSMDCCPSLWNVRHLLGEEGLCVEQNGILEGLELDGILAGLMQGWVDEGRFLGLTRKDWGRFSPAERGLLWTMLLKRRDVMDYGALFERAVRLFVSPSAEVTLEEYQDASGILGTPLAQLGISLVLEGETVLRAPEVIVTLPFKRPRKVRTELAHRRLEILRRLFLPAHVPLRCLWAEDYAVLDETAWLVDGAPPLAPEGEPLRSWLAPGRQR